MRNSTIYLINCPLLDVNYNNTVNFSSKENQINWFVGKTVYKIDNCSYLRKEQGVNISLPFEQLELCNYALLINEDGKVYYYFIIDKIYKNDNMTFLPLKLDVFQTYYFDINFTKFQSLIERQHVDRWGNNGLPLTNNLLTPENLEVGEYVLKNIQTLYDYSGKGGYIVTSSDKLTAKNGGSSSGGSGGGVANKMVSENGFVLIKCMEAFSPTAYDLGDGTLTIGYGVTSVWNPDYFNQLSPRCTEEEASNVFAQLLLDNYSTYVYNTMKEFGVDMSKVKQNEFDAFTSFYYNHGNLRDRKIFIDYCNGVDKQTIYNTWLTTVIMEGTIYEEGLRDRRKREANCFLNGVYDFKPIQNLEGGYVTENDGKGYIPEMFKTTPTSDKQQAIIDSAKKLIGKPYVWGGNYPPLGSDNGTDCSGLCQWAYNDNGISITRTTYTQIKEGIEVTQNNLQLGDLVFTNFSSPGVPEHVFLYSGTDSNGNLLCVEAPRTGLNIRERIFTWESTTRARRILA